MTIDPQAHLKLPIGPFVLQEEIDLTTLNQHISIIENAPAKYRAIATNLLAYDLKKTYRQGSWNIQQLVNHVADIQLLHYFRMKRALTEIDYKEITLINIDGWAFTHDGLHASVADSLDMFETITKRYIFLMRSLNEQQHAISYYHPIRKMMLNQKQAIAMSAWHVQHHVEHIKIALRN